MTPEAAAAVVKKLGGKNVDVLTTWGAVLTGRLVKTTGKAMVLDTEEPGQRGIFLPQVVKVTVPQDKAQLAAAETVDLRNYSDDTRMKYADSGIAMPDGSFPIANRADLARAIKAVGRAKDYDAAKKHIAKRAAALKATDLLPGSWPESTGTSSPVKVRMDSIEKAVVALAARIFED